MNMKVIRGEVVSFQSDPFLCGSEDALVHEDDALIFIEDGIIKEFGAYSELKDKVPSGVNITHYKNSIICPGFIDGHVHYPQIQMIGSYGEHLLDWLNKYTFVAEKKFSDKSYAETVANIFIRELIKAGTTTAAVYCTVHPQSVDAFFNESIRWNTRMVAGKVLMDRNAPDELLDTAERGYDESKKLADKWHHNGRQLYCITPRFAPSCSQQQLEIAGQLLKEKKAEKLFMQTHLDENVDEIAWVKQLFPNSKNYLDVYDKAGLVGPRSIFGHGVHCNENEFEVLHDKGAGICHCPTSNNFLGSGLFKAFVAKDPRRPIRVGLGTDIGAGTSFSQLATLNEAYKVSELNNTKLDAVHAFYLATRGGAELLYLEDKIGTIAPGMEADLTVIDWSESEFLSWRIDYSKTINDRLFLLLCMGSEKNIKATYVYGECVYDRDRSEPFIYPKDL
ncbi:guanine deaminase [Edwardsiella tarda]|uniref:guanine deaminase n=1 Tax=Edwardsiella tarda TaxID=636 RepID=UPI0002DCC58C|nr:guanine deaminase [Edwardsiella tarda]